MFLGIKLLKGELPHITWQSTGLACGKGYNNAAISALYEVIERDSFMLTWQLRLPGKQVIVDHIGNQELSDLYKHICKHLVGEDYLFIYDISRTEGIYTILTFIRNDNPTSFGIITSAASDISAEKAILKSLEELCQTQIFANDALIRDKDLILKKSEVTNLKKHTLYYNTGKRSHEIDFISVSDCYVQLSDMRDFIQGSDKEILEYLVELFRGKNQSVFMADVTRNEIRECGLCVVRAIISGYNDLEYSHNMRLLNNKRLLRHQKKYNVPINDAPHPFP